MELLDLVPPFLRDTLGKPKNIALVLFRLVLVQAYCLWQLFRIQDERSKVIEDIKAISEMRSKFYEEQVTALKAGATEKVSFVSDLSPEANEKIMLSGTKNVFDSLDVLKRAIDSLTTVTRRNERTIDSLKRQAKILDSTRKLKKPLGLNFDSTRFEIIWFSAHSVSNIGLNELAVDSITTTAIPGFSLSYYPFNTFTANTGDVLVNLSSHYTLPFFSHMGWIYSNALVLPQTPELYLRLFPELDTKPYEVLLWSLVLLEILLLTAAIIKLKSKASTES